MADYIYLLETRLSKAQRSALQTVRELARTKGVMVFLVGGAVRDLTSGSPVRDLDVVAQGNALKLKKDLEKLGAVTAGEHEQGQSLFVSFPGGVRMEIGSTLSATYPKPGRPVLKAASLLDDLRRRDFTANAMALSLNEGSYGLLMDPLNGVADIENRELRLVSNYGFIEDPVRMIRAVRMMARLGWTMEEKTQARYQTGKEEGYIAAMGSFPRGYETEEIFHEEEPLRVMRRLEEEGWIAHLFAPLSVAKANAAEMERLRETQVQLQVQGIQADAAAANFPLLTGKLTLDELRELKGMFPRQEFVGQIEHLDAEAKEFAGQMVSKSASLPSHSFQLMHRGRPEAVLWAAHTSKGAVFQQKLKSFFGEWPQARQRIPYALMQEMRIVPDVPRYEELLESVFYALLDGRLGTVEEMRAFLEPYSPPAPPPPVHLRRPRAGKKDAKGGKGRRKAIATLDGNLDRDEEEPEADSGDSETSDTRSDRDDDGVEELMEEEAQDLASIEPATPVEAAAMPERPPVPTHDVPEPPARASSTPKVKGAPGGASVSSSEIAAKVASASKVTATPPQKGGAAKKAAPAKPVPAPPKSSAPKRLEPKPVPAKNTVPTPARKVPTAAKTPVKVALKSSSKKTAAPVREVKSSPSAKHGAAPAKPQAKTPAKKTPTKVASPAKKSAVVSKSSNSTRKGR